MNATISAAICVSLTTGKTRIEVISLAVKNAVAAYKARIGGGK